MGGGSSVKRLPWTCWAGYFAKSTQIHSLSFRTYIFLLANAGMHQTTSRPNAVFVGSIKWARSISS